MKKNASPTRSELKEILAVARGDTLPDLLLKNVTLINLISGGEEKTSVAIVGSWIAGVGLDYTEGKKVIEGEGLSLVPGFIDGHLHIESSLMHPFEFERVTLPLGTTTAICDPHEITNVLGDEGFAWFLRAAENMQQNLYVQVSSCIPSMPGFETQNGQFNLQEMIQHRHHSHVLGLAEMMNFPGVIKGDDQVLDKLEAFQGMILDGHCPLLRGKALNAYIAAGIRNCHETVTRDEAAEKLSKGMSVILREGSVAKNLIELSAAVNEFNSALCFLCTDDRNPLEIAQEGHINYMVKKLIGEKRMPVHMAYRLSSFSAALHFGLKRLGLIAPGYRADFILLEDARSVKIKDVYSGGKNVRELELQKDVQKKLESSQPPVKNTMKRRPLSLGDLNYEQKIGLYHVIEIIPHEIITRHRQLYFDGQEYTDRESGEKIAAHLVQKLTVIERYGHEKKPALGLVMGLHMTEGAIASSVAHDAHNLIVAGTNEADMVMAVNTLIDCGGGFCAVKKGKVVGLLPLPLAGLMSLKEAEVIAQEQRELHQVLKDQIGITLDGPFLQLAFIALPVIPALKLTDQGLVDVTQMKFISYYEETVS